MTLLEVIVVVSIIGIISAIALPRLNVGIGSAGVTAMHEDLALLSVAIELYAAEHLGRYPGSTRADGTNAPNTQGAFLAQMLQYTDANGRAQPSRVGAYRYGPYLRKGIPPLPIGPKAGLTGVKVVTGSTAPAYDAAAEVGWVYNCTTGNILPNVPAANMADLGIDDLVGGRVSDDVTRTLKVGGGSLGVDGK